MCGLSRLLLPAALVGMAVAGLSGSTAAGWLAAAAVAATFYLIQRRRPARACGLSLQKARPFEGLAPRDAPNDDRD